MSKILDIHEAVEKIHSGMTLMIGGFLNCGTPERIIDALVASDVKDLCIIANDTGFPDQGIGKLIMAKKVKKAMVSHIGTNKEMGRQMTAGETEVVLIPQGTLVEQIRAGGMGLGGILTPTGVGTVVAAGKEILEWEGTSYLLERPLRGDVALLYGSVVDECGNIFYRGTTRNFNPVMAMAADTVLVEAQTRVAAGELDPHLVMTPGALVHGIVEGGRDDGS